MNLKFLERLPRSATNYIASLFALHDRRPTSGISRCVFLQGDDDPPSLDDGRFLTRRAAPENADLPKLSEFRDYWVANYTAVRPRRRP